MVNHGLNTIEYTQYEDAYILIVYPYGSSSEVL